MMEFVITNDKIKQLTYIANDEQKNGTWVEGSWYLNGVLLGSGVAEIRIESSVFEQRRIVIEGNPKSFSKEIKQMVGLTVE